MDRKEHVVITHGLWVNSRAMAWLRSRLTHLGHRGVCFSYHSVHFTLSENAAKLYALTQSLDGERIHFVGHSLGGMLTVQMLHEYRDSRFGRVVLAGSPFQGSYVGTKLACVELGRHMLGKSVRQWFDQNKPCITDRHEVGVISGTRSIGLGRLIRGLPSPNDGTIALQETTVPGMTDHLILHVSHTEMLLSPKVARQVDHFLRTGHFMAE